MSERICLECGASFSAPRAEYCLSCRKKRYAVNKRRKAVLILCDTEAMRQTCLKCTRERCVGSCDILLKVARGEA